MSTKLRYQIIISIVGIKAEGSKPSTLKSAIFKPFTTKPTAFKFILLEDSKESKENKLCKIKKEDKGKGPERDNDGDVVMQGMGRSV